MQLAWHKMKVRVKHDLSGGRTIIDREMKPVCFCRGHHCCSDTLGELDEFIAEEFWHVKKVGGVLLRNKEGMTCGVWISIEERDEVRGFRHLSRRDCSLDNLTEETISHEVTSNAPNDVRRTYGLAGI